MKTDLKKEEIDMYNNLLNVPTANHQLNNAFLSVFFES